MSKLIDHIKIIKTLVDKINNLDTYYEMSDSPNVVIHGLEVKDAIKTDLRTLLTSEKAQVILSLSESGMVNYQRYFNTI